MTFLKKEKKWLREVDSVSLQSALKDLDTAYQNFFRRIKENQEAERMGSCQSIMYYYKYLVVRLN